MGDNCISVDVFGGLFHKRCGAGGVLRLSILVERFLTEPHHVRTSNSQNGRRNLYFGVMKDIQKIVTDAQQPDYIRFLKCSLLCSARLINNKLLPADRMTDDVPSYGKAPPEVDYDRDRGLSSTSSRMTEHSPSQYYKVG
jgi:hypothetical protein